MATHDIRHIYGPVPSRRLGRSLGIDLVPFKVCTYDCIYCQLGKTTRIQLNTVCRPPAETAASSLPADQLNALAKLFAPPVDIISHNAAQRTPLSNTDNVREGDILAMLERRPCTVADVARGLGIHVNAALKHLAALVTAGQLGTVVNAGRNFYTNTGMKER